MIGHYTLVGKTPVPCYDLQQWVKWFTTANRRVDQTMVGSKLISTVFLGTDHSFGCGEPELFETMIFGPGELLEGDCKGLYQERCSTWEEAEAMHKRAVESIADTVADAAIEVVAK